MLAAAGPALMSTTIVNSQKDLGMFWFFAFVRCMTNPRLYFGIQISLLFILWIIMHLWGRQRGGFQPEENHHPPFPCLFTLFHGISAGVDNADKRIKDQSHSRNN